MPFHRTSEYLRFNIVDERHIMITNLFWKQLKAELPANRQVTVCISGALGGLAEVIRQRIIAGRVPETAELVHLLRDVDSLWALLPEGEIPCDLTRLGTMSYVIEELRAGMSRNNNDERICIMIDDYREEKIYRYATRIASFLQQNHQHLSFRMLGMYPMGRLLLAGGSLHSGLYFHDPGRHALDARGEIVDLLTVVRSLYAPVLSQGSVMFDI